MRELDTLRKVMKREVRKAVGRHPLMPTLMAAQAQHGFVEHEFLILPQRINNLSNIQTANGTAFVFMAGFSRILGPDPIA